MSNNASTISWTELKPSNPPLERSSHGVSIVGVTLYMLGGEHSARHPVKDVLYALDLDKSVKAWREVEVSGSPPPPRFGHAQSVIDDCIYIFGGRMGIAVGMLNTKTGTGAL